MMSKLLFVALVGAVISSARAAQSSGGQPCGQYTSRSSCMRNNGDQGTADATACAWVYSKTSCFETATCFDVPFGAGGPTAATFAGLTAANFVDCVLEGDCGSSEARYTCTVTNLPAVVDLTDPGTKYYNTYVGTGGKCVCVREGPLGCVGGETLYNFCDKVTVVPPSQTVPIGVDCGNPGSNNLKVDCSTVL